MSSAISTEHHQPDGQRTSCQYGLASSSSQRPVSMSRSLLALRMVTMDAPISDTTDPCLDHSAWPDMQMPQRCDRCFFRMVTSCRLRGCSSSCCL